MALLFRLVSTLALAVSLNDISASSLSAAGSPSEVPAPFDPLTLNIRMTAQNLHPPAYLVKQSWHLEGYRLGRLGPQSPRGAIIEDDAHQRLLILTATAEQDEVMVYRLGELPFDVSPRLMPTVQAARDRRCHDRRMDPAGELGCLALCLLENLQ